MKQIIFMIFLLAGLVNIQCYGQAKKSIAGNSEVLNNASIIELHKAGLDDDIIISKIESSQTNFDLSTAKLIQLKKAGISSAVLKSIMNKTSNATTNSPAKTKTEASYATNAASIDMLNYPYYFNKEQNSYKPTEKSIATMHVKRKVLGLAGTESTYEITGGHSNVRITGDTISFLLNTGGNVLSELVLYKLKADDNKRVAVGTRIPTGFAGFSNKKAPEDVIAFNTVLVKNGLYKITISSKLAPGEYFFSGKLVMSETNTMNVFAFGID